MIDLFRAGLLSLGSPIIVWSGLRGGTPFPLPPTPGRVRPVLLAGSPWVEWSGAFRLGAPTPPPAVTLTLREAIAAWLVSLPGLASAGIYYAQPGQLSAYPCCVLKIPSRSYGHNLYGADGTSRATVEITALALTQSQCVAMAEAIRNYAQGFRGLQSGVAILRMLLDDEADDETPPPDGSDQWIYQITLEYRCDHRVPLPTNVTQTNA